MTTPAEDLDPKALEAAWSAMSRPYRFSFEDGEKIDSLAVDRDDVETALAAYLAALSAQRSEATGVEDGTARVVELEAQVVAFIDAAHDLLAATRFNRIHDGLTDARAKMLEAVAGKSRSTEALEVLVFNETRAALTGTGDDVLAADAARYRFLRDQDIEGDFPRSGVFIGAIPDNTVLTGDDADRKIDAYRLATAGEGGR